MRSESVVRARWWVLRVVLPIVGLSLIAIALGQSELDVRSLAPFFDAHARTFPLRGSWFFDGVLHVGGKFTVIAVTGALIVVAALGLRSARWKPWSGRFAYLAACVLLTAAIGGAWKRLAHQVTPWNTHVFGGSKVWPGSHGELSFFERLGSPGAHAASGFAWVALYFVAASMGARRRGVWLVPGLLLGMLFTGAQHVRGAHVPSHEPWSLAIAWAVACVLAALFRRIGWLDWNEVPTGTAGDDDERSRQVEAAVPWIIGSAGLLVGVAFFALDQLLDHYGDKLRGMDHWFEVLELAFMGPGLGVAAFLIVEHVRALRERALRREQAEREQRLQLLGRMAASVAHEVRNPLHSLRLIVDEQRLDVPALAEHPLRAQFEACLERIDHAVDLVYRLARPGAAEESSADLATAARESITALERTLAGGPRFLLELGPDRAEVRASPASLRIVVENLLHNAAKAVNSGAEIVLTLTREGDDWVLDVRNPGRLNSSSDMAQRGEHDSRMDSSGLGLGLAISRQIAADAGGSIDLSERRGSVHCLLRWPAASDVGS